MSAPTSVTPSPAAPRSDDATGGRRRRGTSRFERLLVAGAIVSLPFENQFTPTGRISVAWIIFALMAVVVLIRRPTDLFRVAFHPALVPVYAFLAVTFLMELAHLHSSWHEWSSTAEMVGGGILLTSFCRDRRAMMTILYAVAAAAAGLAFLFVITSYGPLRNSRAATFREASIARENALAGSPLSTELNPYGFAMAEGAAVCTAFALVAGSKRRTYLFGGLGFLCLMGAFVSLSRAAIITGSVSILVVLFASKTARLKTLGVVAVVAIIFVAVVPNAVFARLHISPGAGKVQQRQVLYETAFRTLPDYAAFGAGAGGFAGQWGFDHGYADRPGITHPQGVHNSYFQIWIFWGTLGLVSFLVALWSLYRGLAPVTPGDVVPLAVRAVATAVLVDMCFQHNFYNKEGAIALAALLVERIWLRAPSTPAALPVVTASAVEESTR